MLWEKRFLSTAKFERVERVSNESNSVVGKKNARADYQRESQATILER